MRRRSVLAAGLAVLGGCAGLAGPSTPTPRDDAPVVREGPGDYPHPIRVDNARDRPATVALAVERDGETLYRGTHRVDAGGRAVVAGVTVEALAPSRRYVTVAATTPDGGRASAGVSVTACLGEVVVGVAPDGTPSVAYSTC